VEKVSSRHLRLQWKIAKTEGLRNLCDSSVSWLIIEAVTSSWVLAVIKSKSVFVTDSFGSVFRLSRRIHRPSVQELSLPRETVRKLRIASSEFRMDWNRGEPKTRYCLYCVHGQFDKVSSDKTSLSLDITLHLTRKTLIIRKLTVIALSVFCLYSHCESWELFVCSLWCSVCIYMHDNRRLNPNFKSQYS